MPKIKEFNSLSQLELIDSFCEIFYSELDSWFSADIACCDFCYDDFVSKWPAIYSRDLLFQKNCIDIKCFYRGSRLQNYFTEEEYLQLINNIYCPHCGNPICNNIWPYSFNFDLPDGFEHELEDIHQLSMKTPFLLLSNSFAIKSYNAIKDLAQKARPIITEQKYYRARKLDKDKIYVNEDFKYPPKSRISEGRYNHAGFPVIYLADSPTTCFYEMRKPNEGIAVAEFNILKPLKILDLIQIEDDWNSVINVALWSSLMSSPSEGEGWYKPQYTFTRFIADCAVSAGFDAIKYPSVRLGEGNNMVILNGTSEWCNLSISRIMNMSSMRNTRVNCPLSI